MYLIWNLVPLLLISSVLGTPTPQTTETTNATVFLPSLFNSNPIPTDAFQSDGALSGSLILHNGRIHTLSTSGPATVSVLAIKSGQIIYTGNSLPSATGLFDSPPKTINLGQKTAVPGLIDSHNHFVLFGNRPGYHTPLEYALSIPDVQQIYRQRIQKGVPEGKWITTIGGFSSNQFAPELRLPTLEELDAVAPNHPVFISTSFAGPATTNSRGKAIVTNLSWQYGPVNVSENGGITSGLENGKALLYLRQQSTFEDRKRSVRDAMAYAASVGVTTHLDQGGFTATNTPSDVAASENLYTFHQPFLSVYASNQALVRLRLNFLHEDTDTNSTTLTQRLLNTFPFFGNSMIRTGAIGEFLVSQQFYAGNNTIFDSGALKIAEAKWRLEVHSLTSTDFKTQIESFERIDAQVSIKDLRWVIAHVPRITEEYLKRLKALGGGVNLSGWQYLSGTGNETNPAGPPWKTIVESGIPAGFGADGVNIAPLSPWPHIYYAITGKNAKGEIINPGQGLTRQKVLEFYTRDNTWFLGGPDEKSLGILEVGRLGDVVVLNEDYFTVPEESLKRLRSVLTVVGGVVVHDSGEL
ncbi:amidohydrolase family-domain-containing protein [Podospora fimiseda]|uniref:Amidohydrolase family-domain-containing protein n=1 Tax=Podospora fimiseda TaxID=252190 RepID=A0AAN7BJZ7_9PEZI|nr:amidohydrolase family-domain-containing protein [Podospora fimiseda]